MQQLGNKICVHNFVGNTWKETKKWVKKYERRKRTKRKREKGKKGQRKIIFKMSLTGKGCANRKYI
jgi:hypothetical protein